MKNIILILAILLGFTANAQQQKNKNAKYSVEVSGNCDMCKNRIEKAAYAVKGVKSANWDVSSQQLQIILNEQRSSVQEVQQAIANAGHDTKEVKTTQEKYDQLHGCCKYERIE